MGRDTATQNFEFGVHVVVPFVEAHVFRLTGLPGTSEDHRIQSRSSEPLVVFVSARQHDGNRNPSTVRQEMALAPALGPVGRVRARLVPPFGALTMAPSNDAHVQAIPFRLS